MLESLFDFSQFFHVGIRVPDIDKAMAEIGPAMGVTWASVQDRQMSMWLPDEGLGVRLYGENLTDEEYSIFTVAQSIGDSFAAAPPRTYAFEVNFNFK